MENIYKNLHSNQKILIIEEHLEQALQTLDDILYDKNEDSLDLYVLQVFKEA